MAMGTVRITLNMKVEAEYDNIYNEDEFRTAVLDNLEDFEESFYNNAEVEILDVELDKAEEEPIDEEDEEEETIP